MQFEHAHTFRGPVVDALQAEMPEALTALTQVGATVVTAPDGAACFPVHVIHVARDHRQLWFARGDFAQHAFEDRTPAVQR
ncbi:hypothetical protein C6A85_10865, partial [Mycobacterium sp. ITM-2017-0098]